MRSLGLWSDDVCHERRISLLISIYPSFTNLYHDNVLRRYRRHALRYRVAITARSSAREAKTRPIAFLPFTSWFALRTVHTDGTLEALLLVIFWHLFGGNLNLIPRHRRVTREDIEEIEEIEKLRVLVWKTLVFAQPSKSYSEVWISGENYAVDHRPQDFCCPTWRDIQLTGKPGFPGGPGGPEEPGSPLRPLRPLFPGGPGGHLHCSSSEKRRARVCVLSVYTGLSSTSAT